MAKALMVWALALLALLAGPAIAQDGGMRVCYAFDAGANTLFASQAVPADQAGRTAEGFVSFLRGRGSIAGGSANCTTVAGEPQANRAREALARSCQGCNAGTRLVSVNWPAPAPPEAPVADRATVAISTGGNAAAAPRGGGIAAQPVGGSAEPAPGPTRVAAALPKPASPTNAPHMGPLLIVMGHEESGKMIAVRDRADLAEEALRQAKAYRPAGWKVLFVSRQTGSGAAICVSDNGRTKFFVAHPFPTVREAIKAAQEMARPTAAKTRSVFFACGAPWTVMGIAPPEPEPSVADTVKGKVREMVTCQEPPALPGGKPARPRCNDAKRTSTACMCVRG